jgi:hypothetical protein
MLRVGQQIETSSFSFKLLMPSPGRPKISTLGRSKCHDVASRALRGSAQARGSGIDADRPNVAAESFLLSPPAAKWRVRAVAQQSRARRPPRGSRRARGS